MSAVPPGAQIARLAAVVARCATGGMPDEMVAAPLWLYPPHMRQDILSERARRGILQGDPEPIGDPEYS
ncbi:hypothetical protein [Streptomyces avermitilis]|uniref:hypothetical protein n=1 Tax=Streptomyces avermitilis TaxID=33903 RepID=UPI00380E190F